MFLNGKLDLQIYSDSAESVYPLQNQPNLEVTWTNLAVTGKEEIYTSIAASGSLSVNLNSLTGVNQFYLISDAADLSLTINGAAGFTYKLGIPGYAPLALTSLVIANSSSSVSTNIHLILIKG